jgi:cytosine deaminase
MADLILRNASIYGRRERHDIAIQDGGIAEVAPQLSREAREEIDVEGRFVSPPFVDAHFHLDAVWTKVPNASGTLREGIDNWFRYKQESLTVDDVYDRAKRYCEHAFGMGLQAIRSHVDVCDPELRGAKALTALKGDMRDLVDIQLVAFPQDGLFSSSEVLPQVKRALDMGVDVVGGIPHIEATTERGGESIRTLMELAADRGLLVDMHCDESDDPSSRQVEVLTAETRRLGMEGRVTASHVTSMATMDRYYVSRKLIPLMAAAHMQVITNPLVNVHLGGHFSHPAHRAMAPLKELRAAGIPVACAQDCNQDPWYPLGNADMTEVAKMAAHISHMMGVDEIPQMFNTITTVPAQIMKLEDYGLERGCRANLVVFDAPDATEVLRTSAPRWLILRDGEVKQRTKT